MSEVFYLSGPMRTKPNHNHDQFIEVKESLNKFLINRGDTDFEIVSPVDLCGGNYDQDVAQFMREDLKAVARADVMVLLPEWETSEGADREIKNGITCNCRFWLALLGPHGDYWLFKPLEGVPSRHLSPRADILREAEALITGDRNNQYGPPTQDFRRSSDAMSAYGYRHTILPIDAPECPTCHARPLVPHDTAIVVDVIKTSRIMWQPFKRDNWADKAGYTGCGYECAMEEKDQEMRRNGSS